MAPPRDDSALAHEASHALRDPLTICRGHLELFGGNPGEQHRTIELVMAELDRMARMIDDLELLAEVGHDGFLQAEWIDLALFTHELVAKAGAVATRDWTLDHVAVGSFFADQQCLAAAVMNLADNAVNHTRMGDTVSIGTMLSDGELRLWVRDAGPGIEPAEHARVFERFSRGRDPQSNRGGGLGLAVVKAIAEAHGGQVELESRPDEGSTFTIVLPRRDGPLDA